MGKASMVAGAGCGPVLLYDTETATIQRGGTFELIARNNLIA